MVYIGIDISESGFVAVCRLLYQDFPEHDRRCSQVHCYAFSNRASLHHGSHWYGVQLLYLLYQSGMAVSLGNLKQIKHFARMMVTRYQDRRERRLHEFPLSSIE